MRSVGLVEASRDGRVVRYRLADPEIVAACDLMRNVIVRRLSALGSLAAAERVPASRPRAGGASSRRRVQDQVHQPANTQVTHR